MNFNSSSYEPIKMGSETLTPLTLLLLLQGSVVFCQYSGYITQVSPSIEICRKPVQTYCQPIQTFTPVQTSTSSPIMQPVCQFIIPAIIKPLLAPDTTIIERAPAVPAPVIVKDNLGDCNGLGSGYGCFGGYGGFPGYGGMPYPMLFGGDDDDDWRNLLFFLIFAMKNKRGGFGGRRRFSCGDYGGYGGYGGCGGCGGCGNCCCNECNRNRCCDGCGNNCSGYNNCNGCNCNCGGNCVNGFNNCDCYGYCGGCGCLAGGCYNNCIPYPIPYPINNQSNRTIVCDKSGCYPNDITIYSPSCGGGGAPSEINLMIKTVDSPNTS